MSILNSIQTYARQGVATVQKYSPIVQRALSKAQAAVSRPSREHRDDARAKKGPIASRIAVAHGIRSQHVAEAASSLNPSNPASIADATAITTHELSHLSEQVMKLSEDLTDLGVLPAGDMTTNLKHGSFHRNGVRIDLYTLVADLILTKSMRLYRKGAIPSLNPSAPGFGLHTIKDALMPTAQPMPVIYGGRTVGNQDDARVQPDDLFAFVPQGTSTPLTMQATATKEWPIGSYVFLATEPQLAPNLGSAAKELIGLFALSSKHWYLKVTALFTEQIGSLLGFKGGVDFTR